MVCFVVELQILVFVEELCLDQERKDCKVELSRRHQGFRIQKSYLYVQDLTQDGHEIERDPTSHFL